MKRQFVTIMGLLSVIVIVCLMKSCDSSGRFTRKDDIPYTDSQSLDLFLPDSPPPSTGYPVVLWIHGGGLSTGDKNWCEIQSDAFARHGFAVIQINYTLTGNPEENFPMAFEYARIDVESALEWIADHATEYHLDHRRVIIAGESVGAELAMVMGIRAGMMKAQYGIGIRGIIDFYGSRLSFMKVWDNPVPLLIVHGTEDPVVPYTDAEEIQKDFLASKGAVEFYSMVGAGHDFRIGRFRHEAMVQALKFARRAVRD